jgi:diphthine synthase
MDLTARGRAAIRDATEVFIEGYTSLLSITPAELSQRLGVPITVLTRTDVEQRIEGILERAKASHIALIVVGDPFGATTHTDLVLRAHAMGVTVQVVHNASILNAVGEVGLELYRFGRTVSIPYWLPGFEPTSFLPGIRENRERGLHTLCLLDIKMDEGRVMTVAEGLETMRKADPLQAVLSDESRVIAIARLGWPDQRIVHGSAAQLRALDLGPSPHAIIVPGKLHPVEEEMLQLWTI